MPTITVYSSPFCPYCFMAKRLLKDKGVAFDEIDVMMHPRRRAEMVERANGRGTVPQIFIGEAHVGGCDDLIALDKAGRLDSLLADAA
ncbi:MAG: glutaredoxin 3 [Alphaproteobacteria bacterium]